MKSYDETMSRDNLILHSGNKKAYEALMYSLENPSQSQFPIHIFGKAGSGKTALLSHVLIQGEQRGLCPRYVNIRNPPEHLPKTNLIAIDELERISTSADPEWAKNLVYKLMDQGSIPNAIRFLSFSGSMSQYANFLDKISPNSLKDRLKLGEKIELKYPQGYEHELFIRKAVEDSRVAPSNPEQLEEIVSYINTVIPKTYPISVREIQGYLTQAINPGIRSGRITTEGVKKALRYQSVTIKQRLENPETIFKEIIQETGYDIEIIMGPRGEKGVTNMKKEVIKLLVEKGITSPSEIGKLMNADHTTILYHLKNMGIK